MADETPNLHLVKSSPINAPESNLTCWAGAIDDNLDKIDAAMGTAGIAPPVTWTNDSADDSVITISNPSGTAVSVTGKSGVLAVATGDDAVGVDGDAYTTGTNQWAYGTTGYAYVGSGAVDGNLIGVYGQASALSPDDNVKQAYGVEAAINLAAPVAVEAACLLVDAPMGDHGTDANVYALIVSGGKVKIVLPTSDPGIAGVLWNDSGTVKVSAGA